MANLINVLFHHEGKAYDIQAEDMGQASGEVDLRIYHEGAIVFQKRQGYREQVAADASPLDHDQQVRAIMVRQIEALKRGIAAGKVKAQ